MPLRLVALVILCQPPGSDISSWACQPTCSSCAHSGIGSIWENLFFPFLWGPDLCSSLCPLDTHSAHRMAINSLPAWPPALGKSPSCCEPCVGPHAILALGSWLPAASAQSTMAANLGWSAEPWQPWPRAVALAIPSCSEGDVRCPLQVHSLSLCSPTALPSARERKRVSSLPCAS